MHQSIVGTPSFWVVWYVECLVYIINEYWWKGMHKWTKTRSWFFFDLQNGYSQVPKRPDPVKIWNWAWPKIRLWIHTNGLKVSFFFGFWLLLQLLICQMTFLRPPIAMYRLVLPEKVVRIRDQVRGWPSNISSLNLDLNNFGPKKFETFLLIEILNTFLTLTAFANSPLTIEYRRATYSLIVISWHFIHGVVITLVF